MTVYIEKLESPARYNWRVKVGQGRGSRILSRHELKRQALKSGRREARKRSDVLKEQLQWGGWRTVRAY